MINKFYSLIKSGKVPNNFKQIGFSGSDSAEDSPNHCCLGGMPYTSMAQRCDVFSHPFHSYDFSWCSHFFHGYAIHITYTDL